MPCKKCKDGKYKYGNTGECKYSTKEACEKANPKKYNKMKPTPLGKTYEEYEKELKEYKIDALNLAKAQKVELGDLQDLEKLLKDSLTTRKRANQLALKAEDRYTDVRKGLERVEEITKERQKIEKKVDDDKKVLSGDRSELLQQIQQLQSNVKRADQIVRDMTNVEKELGVTIPGLKKSRNIILTFAGSIQGFIDSYDTTKKGM